MSLSALAARGAKWQFLEIAGRQGLGMVVFTCLARLLEPSAFGLVGMVGVYLAFVAMFVDQGIGTALVQRKILEPEHLDGAFWFNIACAAAISFATAVFAHPIAAVFDEATLAPLLRWASLSLVLNAMVAVQGALFLRATDFRRPMLRTLLANAIGGIVGVAMAFAGYGVWALIGQQLASSTAGAIFIWTVSEWRPRLRISARHVRDLLGVSSSVLANSLLWFVTTRLDQIVIGRVFGSSSLGQYVIGSKLTDVAKMAVEQPVASVAIPSLARFQDDYPGMCRAITKGMAISSVIIFAVFGGLVAVAPILLPLVFGNQWKDATVYLQLWSLHSLVLGLFVYTYPALLASGGPGRFVIVGALATLGTAIACWFGRNFGPVGILVALIINMAFSGILALLFIRKRIGLGILDYLRPAAIPAVAAAVMIATTMSIPLTMSNWGDMSLLGAQIVCGALVYICTLYLLDVHRFRDLCRLLMLSVANRSARGPDSA